MNKREIGIIEKYKTLKFEIARMLDIKKKVLIGLAAGDSGTTIAGFEKYAL